MELTSPGIGMGVAGAGEGGVDTATPATDISAGGRGPCGAASYIHRGRGAARTTDSWAAGTPTVVGAGLSMVLGCTPFRALCIQMVLGVRG